ncbi:MULTISPECIES: phosphopantetheine-containing protein [Pseudomonas]|uniref:phosphopantetheine-containing protein n=1 Tax=Pseudomonas TaxID=286 RepID=UPI000CD59BBF|nr:MULTISPECIES: phosphopantetheine-containing protein [Pseudomonas]RBH59521.1 acyl carrier protein [Pseudomonas sp. MWU13-2860]
MKRADIRKSVHDFVSQRLDDHQAFADDQSLQGLGFDTQDIEDLMFHLEDEFDLTAFTEEEDRLLKEAVTVNDLSHFLEKIARH